MSFSGRFLFRVCVRWPMFVVSGRRESPVGRRVSTSRCRFPGLHSITLDASLRTFEAWSLVIPGHKVRVASATARAVFCALAHSTGRGAVWHELVPGHGD